MATSSQSYDRRRRISAALRRLMPSGGHTWTVPVITLLLLLGLVAGAVIMSTVTRRHVQLDDGTVWVTSLKNQKAARFNVKNKEADAGVSSSAPRFPPPEALSKEERGIGDSVGGGRRKPF